MMDANLSVEPSGCQVFPKLHAGPCTDRESDTWRNKVRSLRLGKTCRRKFEDGSQRQYKHQQRAIQVLIWSKPDSSRRVA